jgi:predicted O-methyltransferase YrrM
MSLVPTLIAAYRARGFDIVTGLEPKRHGGLPQAPFTWLTRHGRSVTNGLGITLQETFIVADLAAAARPKTIFVIGNSFGWSTLALGLACPTAKVIAIDACLDVQTRQGLALTNQLARDLGLKHLAALEAMSPRDVARVVKKHLGGKVGFAFIDGLHTNAQVVLDAQALKPFMAPRGTLLFHDVLDFGLEPGLQKIAQAYKAPGHILTATPSGMGLIALDPAPAVKRALAAYAPPAHATAVLGAKAAWDHAQRRTRLARTLWRSILKRLPGFTLPPKPNFHTGEIDA